MSARRSTTAKLALAITAVAGLSLSGLPGAPAAVPAKQGSSQPDTPLTSSAKERKGSYDAREGSDKARAVAERNLVKARGPQFERFTDKLGGQALIDFDPATGTPRNLGKLDGFLTGRSTASARSVALGYVRANVAQLGLTAADLSTFQLRKEYVDVAGIHHLSWTQSVKGVIVFGNGLKANVTKDGRLISIQGSPISGLAKLAGSTATPVPAAQARAAAAKDVGGRTAAAPIKSARPGLTKWSNHDQAKLVWFLAGGKLALGWSTYVQAGGDTLNYQHVIDARTGRVLYRHDTVDHDRGDALVFDHYPGAPAGGTQKVVNLYDQGYLLPGYSWLVGSSVVAWADINDDNQPNKNERTPIPGTKKGAQWFLQPFNNASGLCSSSFVCSWDPNLTASWMTNRNADVTNGFYHDSVFHDYLAQAPIGFNAAAGNFALSGGDPVLLNALDGAATSHRMPDANHIDNANMSTPPDGIPPTMQMYLWHFPGTSDADEPFLPTSSSLDPSVIYHEYTHGLSNRLVVDADGNSTLNSIQAGSMGEAWSDYYAMDYLVTNGLVPDTAASGEVFLGSYLMAEQMPFRTMALDCEVGSAATGCVSPFVADDGGYTYGDFPQIGGSPEVHSSGEVWAQTLWDIRKALGHNVADMLITRGMELSAADPTMLDMRNAIIQADQAVYSGANTDDLWSIFANRGMGWFAGTLDGGDAHPVEDFSVAPAPGSETATLSGTVSETSSGDPVPDALVAIGGHDSGTPGDYSAVTDVNGQYTIDDVFLGTYPVVYATAPGYEPDVDSATVESGGSTADFVIRRDWAASSGGASISDFNGPDYSDFGCGPGGAIDLSQGTGWGSTTGDDAGTPTNVFVPKFITVDLPITVTVTGFAVNPSNTCGDPGSSSTGAYRIETSPDGTTWTTAAEGTFTSAQRMLNEVSVGAPITGVQHVKFWMLGNQVPSFATNCPAGAFGGCTYTDMVELEVFGTP